MNTVIEFMQADIMIVTEYISAMPEHKSRVEYLQK